MGNPEVGKTRKIVKFAAMRNPEVKKNVQWV